MNAAARIGAVPPDCRMLDPGGNRMPEGDGQSLRLTYAQLAEARGISRASAERLVRARKWPRILGNDGVAIVIVPPGEASPGSGGGSAPGSGGGKPGGRRRPRIRRR